MACFESYGNILFLTSVNFFFTLSLFSFAISFSAKAIFESLGHVSHFKLFANRKALSHESKFAFNSSKFSISWLITFAYLCNSSILSRAFFILFNSKIQEYNSSLNSLVKILPHTVFEKSISLFSSILNSSIFSCNHSSGNGLAPNKFIYF